MLKSIRLVALEQQNYHIPVLQGIPVDQIKTQHVPAIRRPSIQVDRVTLYTCSDVPALMLIAGSIDDFRRCVAASCAYHQSSYIDCLCAGDQGIELLLLCGKRPCEAYQAGIDAWDG